MTLPGQSLSPREPRRRAVLVGGLVGGMAFLALMALVTQKFGPLAELDRTAVAEMHTFALANQWFVTMMKVVSTVGSPMVYAAVAALLAAWLVLRRRKRAAAFVLVAVGVGLVIAPIAKRFVGRPRPAVDSAVSHAGGYSFPSGHAVDVTVVLLVLLVLCLPHLAPRARTWATVAVVAMALLMGLARVGLGVHYPSDVAAGYALGVAWVALALITIRPGRQGRH